MPVLRQSESRSRIIISRPSTSVSSPSAPESLSSSEESPETLAPYLLDEPPAGQISTGLYVKRGRRFFARLLSSLSLAQVYYSTEEAEEEHIDDRAGLFALEWNKQDALGNVAITLRELEREVRVNGKRIDVVIGHKLANDDDIDVGPSKLGDSEGTQDRLTFRLDHFFIPDRDRQTATAYKMINWTGKGSYGRVAKVQHATTGQCYAIKRVRPPPGSSIDSMMREPHLWRNLSHEYICQFHQHWVEAESLRSAAVLYIVTNYAPHGTLLHHADRLQATKMKVQQRIAKQICEALDYLHGQNVVHCDFKPDNVVVERLEEDGSPGKVTVIDFGLALRIEDLQKLKMVAEPFRAPEIGLDNVTITPCIDSFAMAATLFHFVTGGKNLVQVVIPKRRVFGHVFNAFEERNKVRVLHLEYLDSHDSQLKDFITRLSLQDPAERMKPREAFSHPWLQPRVSPEPISSHIEELEQHNDAEDDEPATTKRNRSQRSATPTSSSQLRCDKRPRRDSEEGRRYG